MLRSVDSAARARWMGLLARAGLDGLEDWAARLPRPRYVWLRAPETGLVMLRARAGGTGGQFNLGEMTVTRCALRMARGVSGVAYVQGRSHRKAELAALADALLQTDDGDKVMRELIEPLERRSLAEAERMRRKAQATRVEFFTVARESAEAS